MSVRDELLALVRRRLGIQLTAAAHGGVVESFVSARAAELDLPGPAEYLGRLSVEPLGGEEFKRLVSVVTTAYSFFFRDPPQFAAMADLLRRRAQDRRGPVQIWSAGCSTGEEPYSLAMLCADLRVEAQILATDVNRESLEIAREACYARWSLRHLPPDYERFFDAAGSVFRVLPELRARVAFAHHNLVENVYPTAPGNAGWDLVLCRNVLIFFDPAAVVPVIARFAGSLAADGWLLLSTAESLASLETPMRVARLGRSFGYQRKASSPEIDQDLRWTPRPKPDRPVPEPVSPAPQVLVPAAPRPSYRDATEQIEADRLDEARAVLQAILAVEPQHLPARITLGNLLLRQHAFEQALVEYRKAQNLAPLLPEIHFFQGIVYRKVLEWPRAAACFRQALFLQPAFWPASFLLAGVSARLGRPELRRRSLKQALSGLASAPAQLFSSHVIAVREALMDPVEVAAICRRLLLLY